MALSTFYVCQKQVQWLKTTTVPTWSTAIVQTSKWPTQEKIFTPGSLSYLLINNSYNVVAIKLQLMIAFSRISSKAATKLYQYLLYMEIANLFFFFFFMNSHAKMAT